MPIKYYGLYEVVHPFVEGSYKVGEKENARQMAKELIQKSQESLTYYKGLEINDIEYYAREIITEIEIWRSLLQIIEEEDPSYYASLVPDFNTYNGYFKYFKRANL